MASPQVAISAPSDATSEDGAHLKEATMFFSQILSGTKNPLIASMAEENLRRLSEDTAMHRVEVPLVPQMGNSLAVTATLNNRVAGTFIVDTGATYTVITPGLARKLNLVVPENPQRMTIMTANGTVSVPMMKVDTLNIGGVEVHDVTVLVQSLGSDDRFTGLLGMNVFKNMEMTIRPNKLILSMNPD